MNKVVNILENYHNNQTNYVKSKFWRSLSANEIVEYNIRSLPFNSSFNSPSLFKRLPLFCLLFFVLLLFSPLYIVFSILFFLRFYITRNKRLLLTSQRDIFFIRNSLSQKKFELLKKSGLITNSIIVYDDFVKSGIEGYGISAYLESNVFKFILFTLREHSFVLFDSVINLPKINWNKLVKVSLRIPHLCLTYLSLDTLCKINSIEHLRSFEMISRFSSVLNKVVINSDIEMSTGYPHGLEYDVSYPHGYFGKKFFCTSIKSKKLLSIRYPKISFEYDKNLIECLFKFDVRLTSPKKVVYFTDARNVKEDYFNIKYLNGDIDFVKLHPSDNLNFYSNIETPFIDDFIDAISQGIIIMRPSTVIFEGLNSQCIVFCLATNDKEKYMLEYLYPTLSDLNNNLNLISDLSTLNIIKALDV